MNFRLTAVLFAVAVVLVSGLVLMTLLEGDSSLNESKGSLGEPLTKLGIKEKDITSLELVRTQPGEEKLLFTRSGDSWELQQPVKAKVDGRQVADVVRDIFNAKPIRFSGPLDNLAIHELDKPTFRVTIRDAENHSLTVNIGRSIPGTGSATIFVSTSERPNKAMAVRQSDLAALIRESGKDGSAWQIAKWLTDYRQKKLFGSETTTGIQDVSGIKMSYVGKELQLKRDGGTWSFVTPAGYGQADDIGASEARPNNAPLTGVNPLMNLLTALQVTSNEDIIEKPADLSVYGLKDSDPILMRVELSYRNGKSEVVRFGKVVEENGKPVVPTKVFAQLQGDSAVLQVPTEKLEGLHQTVVNSSELRNRDLFAAPRKQQMDALDVTFGSNSVKLRKLRTTGESGTQWVLYDATGKAALAKNSEVELLLSELTKPRAASEVLSSNQDAAFAEQPAKIRVWLDGLPKLEPAAADKLPPEPKIEAQPIELTFGKSEGTLLFLRKVEGGQTIDYKVPTKLLELTMRSRLDLLDPQLKSFSTQQVTSLFFNRGAVVYQLTKKSDSTWLFESPEAMKGLPADANKCLGLAGMLSALYAEKIVTENPTPEELKKYGVDPNAPRLKVIVGLTGAATSSLTYDLGFAATDDKSLFARQSGSSSVLLVGKNLFDRFNTEDLLDTVLHRLDGVTISKLKIRGWKGKMDATPVELVLERQANGWAAISPPSPAGLAVDPTKVEALVQQLLAPQLEGKPEAVKPEQGLDVLQNTEALEITIERKDNLPAVVLKVGAKADGKNVFAVSSAFGEGKVAVPIDAGGIRQHLGKPTGLAK